MIRQLTLLSILLLTYSFSYSQSQMSPEQEECAEKIAAKIIESFGGVKGSAKLKKNKVIFMLDEYNKKVDNAEEEIKAHLKELQTALAKQSKNSEDLLTLNKTIDQTTHDVAKLEATLDREFIETVIKSNNDLLSLAYVNKISKNFDTVEKDLEQIQKDLKALIIPASLKQQINRKVKAAEKQFKQEVKKEVSKILLNAAQESLTVDQKDQVLAFLTHSKLPQVIKEVEELSSTIKAVQDALSTVTLCDLQAEK